MSKKISAFVALLIICLCFVGCGTNIKNNKSEVRQITDIKGNVVQVPFRPQKVMSLTTGTDEVVLGLLEPERIVAVNEMFKDEKRSNVLNITKKIQNTVVRNPSVEAVAALKPDLVFAQEWIPPEKISALKDLGIPVVICKTPRNFQDVRDTVKFIADALNEKERGEKLISMMDEKLLDIKKKIDKLPEEQKGKTIALVSVMPAYGGKGCMFDDVLFAAGARNAKALAGNQNGTAMTKEQFIACDPDYIFLPSYDNIGTKEEKYGKEYMSDPSLQVMRAVKENHVKYPWAHYIYNISQNVVFGAQEAAYILYGDEFKQPRNCHLSAVSSGNGNGK